MDGELIVMLVAAGGSVAMLGATWAIGRGMERAHFRSIEERERALAGILVSNEKRVPDGRDAEAAKLVVGSVVMGSDHFKRWVAGLKRIIGGRLRSLETVIERARREAILRMLAEAKRFRADMVLNVRVETASLGQGQQNQQNMAMSEVIAYGTAVRLKRDAEVREVS